MKFKGIKEITKIDPAKPVKKGHKLLLFKSSVLFFLTACAVYGLFSFFTTYGLQSPIILRSPIYPLKHEVMISPVASKSAMLKDAVFNVGAIADKIYQLESSGGKNDSCRALGMFNGFGYRQNSFEWMCYSSHEEVRNLVINWLTQHIKSGDIQSALCLYNEGKIESQCRYSLNALALN